MTVTVNARELATAIARSSQACGKAKLSPYLEMLRITVASGTMELVGTNLEMRIASRLPAAGEIAAFCVDVSRLDAVIARIKDKGEVTIKSVDNSIEIVAGRSRFTLPVQPIDGFPDLKPTSMPWSIKVEGKVFARIMTALEPAMSTEETRYYLNGICLASGGVDDQRASDRLVAVATNGHVLAARDVAAAIEGPLVPVIVPRRSCSLLGKFLADTGEVEFGISDTRISVVFEDYEFLTKLVEGTYPDWRRVAPKRVPNLSFETPKLIDAIATAGAATNGGKDGKSVKWEIGDEETEFLTRSPQGEAPANGTDACAHFVLSKPPISEISMNADYAVDMLKHLDAETVEIGFADASSPICLTGAGLTDRRFIIMPTRF